MGDRVAWEVELTGNNRRALAVPLVLLVLLVPSAAAQVHNGFPVVSPDGSEILFMSNRTGVGGADEDVYSIRADGSGEKRLTFAGAHSAWWSRDGREVFYSGAGADSGRVFALRNGERAARLVATVPGRAPRLSPDGRRVAFMAGTWTATALMVADVNGSNIRRVAGGSGVAWNPAWSPGSRSIAYTYGAPERRSGGSLEVHVVGVDDGEDRAVSGVAANEGSPQVPAWSSDGRRIAFQVNARDSTGSRAHVWIVDLISGDARKLGAHSQPYVDETPSWFPDGKRVAIQSDRSGRMELWIVNVDNGRTRQLTDAAR